MISINNELARIESENTENELDAETWWELQEVRAKSGRLPRGAKYLAEVEEKENNDVDNIETGFVEYDRYIEDWKPGEITVVFGRNGEGKTTWISQVIAHAIEKDVKTFLYSGELSDSKIKEWLHSQLIGSQTEHLRQVKGKYREKYIAKPESLGKIKNWYSENLTVFDKSERKVMQNIDNFFRLMALVSKAGVKLFVIDNLMSILEENADSLYSDQANFVQNCKNFADDYNIHLVLLCHPNKVKGEISEEACEKGNLEKNDVSGSNNIPNKADNIISIERNWHPERNCDLLVTSHKDRNEGQRRVFKYYFSTTSKRFYNDVTPETVIYGWQKGKEEDFGTQLDIKDPF